MHVAGELLRYTPLVLVENAVFEIICEKIR